MSTEIVSVFPKNKDRDKNISAKTISLSTKPKQEITIFKLLHSLHILKNKVRDNGISIKIVHVFTKIKQEITLSQLKQCLFLQEQ